MTLRHLLLFIFCFLFHDSMGQQPYYLHLTKATGLPCNEVYDLYQDKKGYMWIASDCGLYRFDGVSYVSYSNPDMSTRAGTQIREDALHRIWYKTFNGEVYYTEGDHLTRFTNEIIQGELILIDSFMVSHVGTDRVLVYNIFSRQLHADLRLNLTIATVYQVDGHFGVSYTTDGNRTTSHSIFSVRGEIRKVMKPDPGHTIYRCQIMGALCYALEYDAENIYAYELNGTRKELLFTSPYDGVINGFEVKSGRIYLLKKSGLVSYSLHNHRRESYSLPNFSFSYILTDLNGYTWLSTTFDGILILPPHNQITQYEVPYKFTGAIKAGEELFLTSTHGAVFLLRAAPFSLKKVYQEKYNANNYDIIRFPDGAKLDPKELGEFDYFFYQGKKYLVTKSGFKDAEIIDHQFLISAFTGMVRMVNLHLNSKGSSWLRIMSKHRSVIDPGAMDEIHVADLLGGVRANHLVYDSIRKTIFVSSNLGIKQITPDTMTDFTLAGQTIFAQNLFLYGNKLFMHLHTGKLLIYDAITKRFDENNYHLKTPFSLVKMYDSILFLANDKEIYRINLWDNLQVAMPIAFPFTENDVEDIAYVDRHYWILGATHLYKVRDTIFTEEEKMPFFIHRMYSRNRNFLLAEECRFDHDDNDITIEFSYLNYYRHSERIEYKINEDTWKVLKAGQRSINFNSLAPGKYAIDFRISNTNYPRALVFSILSPWYMQWYFFLFLLVAVTLISFVYYRFRLAVHRKEDALILEKTTLQRDLRNSRMVSIKSQMNPHFLFNALNTIQSFIFSEDKHQASAYLSKFSKLARKVLEMSERETITLEEEISALELYLEMEKVRFEDFKYHLLTDPELDRDLVRIPTMIIQPYVENAIKHGLMHKNGSKLLTVTFTRSEERMVRIEIRDNGIGRKRSQEINRQRREHHRSFAMKANRQRVDILRMEDPSIHLVYKDLYDTEGQACGTLVQITLPINPKSYESDPH